jgi:hypothetical protein
VLRDRRGDWLGATDTWLSDVKNGLGTGHDVLRLAVARAMADVAPRVGRPIADEAAARDALGAIASAIPGACVTYRDVADGADLNRISPELHPDHSACVQKDLSRREGPGPTYGTGTFRATEGALALWREMERALRMGSARAEAGPKATLEKKLAIIEAATAKISTTKQQERADDPSSALMKAMRASHAEAGIAIQPEAGVGDAAALRGPSR